MKPSRSLIEIAAVILTGIGHLIFSAWDAGNIYIPLVFLGWGAYVYFRTRRRPSFPVDAGFTRRNVKPAFRDASLAAAGFFVLMVLVGVTQDALVVHPDMLPLLLLYPIWGLLQQFLVQALVAGNLSKVNGPLGSPYAVIPLTALVFASVHATSPLLAAGAFIMGLVFTPLYLKHRNLWPLGLYHGWLGVFYYFWVLGRNPWRYITG